MSKGGKKTRFKAGSRISSKRLCLALQTRAADPNLRHEVTEVLDAAKRADLSVIRTWAFCKPPAAHPNLY